jgi:hypothetical protein
MSSTMLQAYRRLIAARVVRLHPHASDARLTILHSQCRFVM